MSISRDDTSYTSDSKAEWRQWIYDLLTPSRTRIVDADGNLNYKWVEGVGENALTFKQLINSGKITEDKLIGIDYDVNNIERSINNIENCRTLFPQSEFYATEWMEFCSTYTGNDIAVFIFDFYTSTYGESLKMMLEAALPLLEDCKRYLGEIVLVVNADIGSAIRFNDGDFDSYAHQLESIFKKSDLMSFKAISIDSSTCYTYKQSGGSTIMASFAIFL